MLRSVILLIWVIQGTSFRWMTARVPQHRRRKAVLHASEAPLYCVRILNALNEVSRKDWNSLTSWGQGGDKNENLHPFLQYDWLNALEESGCVNPRRGWQPLHIVVYKKPANITEAELDIISRPVDKMTLALGSTVDSKEIVAVMPLYAKFHSQGEFIFDHSWADYCERMLGIQYYPKLLSAIPMTPTTTSKILYNASMFKASIDSRKMTLTSQMEVARVGKLLSVFLQQLTSDNKLSSANVNFMRQEEVPIFLDSNYSLRETIQYRFTNINSVTGNKFVDFEDYLSSFKSKRRIKIKAERRKVYEDQGLVVKVINGADPEADEQFYITMFRLYCTTVDKMWGQQYLTEDFFKMLYKRDEHFRKHLVFMVAYNNSKIVAGTINIVSNSHFYGRYWGAFEFFDNLHFEVCYYKAIEYCIDNNIKYMEPGAGGGSFKFLRGFDPFIVNSVHWFPNPVLSYAVNDFLQQERLLNQEVKKQLLDLSKEKKKKVQGQIF
jgi:predicted N-acyltransferase